MRAELLFPGFSSTKERTLRLFRQKLQEAQHVFIHGMMNVGVGGSVILECFLPSFLPCLWSCSVRYTHFPSALTDEGGEESRPNYSGMTIFGLITHLVFYLLFTSSPSLTPSHLSPLSLYPSPSIPLPSPAVLVSQERMKPLPSTGN